MSYESISSAIEQEALYGALFDAMPGNAHLIKADAPRFTIVAATPRLLKLSGLKKEAVVGKGIFEAFPSNPQDINDTGESNLRTSLMHVLQHKERHQLPILRYDLADENGSFVERYWRVENSPVLAPDGQVAYILHTSEDITDQIKAGELNEQRVGRGQATGSEVTDKVLAKEVVAESETKYRSLFKSIDQGFCIIEMLFDEHNKPIDYRFLEINPMFEQQTGLKGAEGKRMRELVPHHDEHWFKIYGKVALTGEPIRFVEHSESLGRWFDVYAYPIDRKEDRKVALLFSDITERKKVEVALRLSENNLRNMILQAPVAMAILRGPSFVVEIANERMYELWGRGAGELLNKSIFVGLPEVKDQGYEELLTGVYTTGKTFSALGIPVTLPRSEGIKTVYINLLYEAFREGDGTISGIMAVATDVTEQVLATQKIEEVVAQRTKELERANTELRRSNQNLEDFAYAASHDLKEPVRKVQFFSDRLKGALDGVLNETQQRLFERIENANRRMGLLIDDLLTYSQFSRGIANPETVDLDKKVQLVLEDLELSIQEKEASISVDPLPTIQGQRRQLQQLFQNLLSNALKYSKQDVPPVISIRYRTIKGKEAPVSLTEAEKELPFHLIEVKDNGIGFEQKEAERIFQMFQRLHGKTEYEGTGIGLAIVQKVVENHRGYIWATSAPGAGATFTVLLPAG